VTGLDEADFVVATKPGATQTYRQQEKGNQRLSRFAAASIDSSRELSKRVRIALHEARAAESSGADSSQDLVE
jgi:hypothetical protein